MVVDNFQNFRLLQSRDRLRHLVVVNQHHALALGLNQMEARERADNLFIFVQNRIAAMAAAGDSFFDIVDKVGQMKRLQIVGAADTLDGNCLINHTRSLERVIRRDNDACVGWRAAQILRELCLTDNQAADIHFNGAARHFGLLATDDNGLLARKEQIRIVLRQGNAHLTADTVNQMAGLVDNFAVKDA